MTTTLKGKRFLLAVLALLCAALMAITLVGCGSSDEEQAKTAVSDELEALKNRDEGVMEQLNSSISSLETAYGIDSEEFLNTWLDGYDYEVGNVTLSDDKTSGTVEAKITVKQVYPVMADWLTNYYTWAMDNLSSDTDAMQAKATEMLIDEFANATPVTTDVSINVQKSDNGWEPVSASDLEAALLGDSSALSNAVPDLS